MLTFSQWLAANKYDESALNADMRKHLEAAWKAEIAAANPAPKLEPKTPLPNAGAVNDLGEAKAHYQEFVVATCKQWRDENPYASVEKVKQLGDLRQAALDDPKMDKADFRYQMLRFDRTVGLMVTTPRQPEMSSEIIEAALCTAAGVSTVEKDFKEPVLEAAHKQFRNNFSLLRLVGICARQNGWRGDDVKSDLRNALKAAFGQRGNGEMMNVGPSTLSVSGILSNTAQKSLRDGWMGVESSWRPISAIKPVSDFKTITSYSLTGDLTYTKLAPGGQIQHGTLGNETYTNAADMYAKFLGIDYRDLKNDDLGAFSRIKARLGRGGALTLNEIIWAEFLADHSTFFPTDASLLNYDEGTDTAFGADGLTAAGVFWDAKTDPDGKPLAIRPRFLLVPPAHKIPAKRLMESQGNNKDSDLGNSNPHAGSFEVVCSTYLANSAMAGGYSTLAWYMVADPNDLPVIEVCFLDGNDMPVIEDVELDSDRLGIGVRAYHAFGANKQEYRAALKLKGGA